MSILLIKIQQEVINSDVIIENDTHLSEYMERYLSKGGVIPNFYGEICRVRNSRESSNLLNSLIKLRLSVNRVINGYKNQ